MLRSGLLGAAALIVSVLAVPSQLHAWGAAGHAIVAEIAQRRLQPATRRKIAELLGGDVSLASISSWADTLALTKPHTRRWHYVNIPVGAKSYDPARDCEATPQGARQGAVRTAAQSASRSASPSECIVAAIERAVATLSGEGEARARRAEALKLLVHLVADVHQPLHCAERNGDAGGSTLGVTFFGSPSTLHQVWDVGLIEKASYDWGEHVRLISERLAKEDTGALVRGDAARWAWETHLVAVEAAYGPLDDQPLAEAYQARNLPVVHRQLGLAGLRLARLLDEALSGAPRTRPRPRHASARCVSPAGSGPS